MELIFSNTADDPVADFMAKKLQDALLSIDQLRGSAELFFEARPFRDDEPRTPSAKCAVTFALLDEEKKHVLLPVTGISALNGYLSYSETINSSFVFMAGYLGITRNSIEAICNDGIENVLDSFRRG